MYKIYFYKKRNGESPVADYIERLKKENSKDSRLNYTKIMVNIHLLKEKGLSLGMPYIRRIEDNIWEIRANKNRIMFFPYNNDSFVLLHCFYKKTKKTPENEKATAKREMDNYLLGGGNKNEGQSI